jgi:arabinogalactan endo-1,4-beta-galactosidase
MDIPSRRFLLGLVLLESACAMLAQAPAPATALQIIGADVSFLRQMEQNGVVFKDSGTPKPGLQVLKDHG